MNLGEFELVASNIVRILNIMREYQFREELIKSLKLQIEDKQKRVAEVEEDIRKAKDVLKSCVELMETIPREVVPTGQMEVESVGVPLSENEEAKRDGSRMKTWVF